MKRGRLIRGGSLKLGVRRVGTKNREAYTQSSHGKTDKPTPRRTRKRARKARLMAFEAAHDA